MEQISLAKNRVTRHYVKDISFGNIPKSAMLSIFSNGRILGNLIEFEILATFKGFRTHDVGTNDGAADLIYGEQEIVQVKTSKSNKNGNSITRSCLFDTKSRRSNEEWDQLHNTSTQKIDSFIFVDTHFFERDGSVDIVWIEKNDFKDMMRKHTREQEAAEFKKTWRQIRPSWEMPISIDKKMWDEIKNKCK